MRSTRGIAGADALLAAALAALVIAGCEVPGAATAGGQPSPDDTGSVQLELHVAGRFQLSTVTYQITRGAFQKTGSWDVSHSAELSGVIGGIPAAAGYSIALQATDVAQQLVGCQGSATFDVVADAITPAAVHLTCREARPAAVPVPIPPATKVALTILLPLMGLLALQRKGRSVSSPNS